eukprot:3669879-Rhodomonas_salina.1
MVTDGTSTATSSTTVPTYRTTFKLLCQLSSESYDLTRIWYGSLLPGIHTIHITVKWTRAHFSQLGADPACQGGISEDPTVRGGLN